MREDLDRSQLEPRAEYTDNDESCPAYDRDHGSGSCRYRRMTFFMLNSTTVRNMQTVAISPPRSNSRYVCLAMVAYGLRMSASVPAIRSRRISVGPKSPCESWNRESVYVAR